MLKKIYLPLLICIVFLMTSCVATRPTPEQLRNANYGPYPENYEQIIKDYYNSRLFDPYSAVYTFSMSPINGWNGLMGLEFGWIVCGTVNAKNRMGGYVGSKPFYVLIRNRLVVRAFEESFAQAFCSNP